MVRSTFSILCGVLIFSILARESATQFAECKAACAHNEECRIKHRTPSCVCKRGWKRLKHNEPCYWDCMNDTDCNFDDYCTRDYQCKPR